MRVPYREVDMGPVGRRLPEGGVVAARVAAGGVEVVFDDATVTFLADWLRDNCQCDRCRIRQTDERRWQPWTEPAAPVASAVSVVDGRLEAQWANGHGSTYGPPEWQKIRRTASRGAWTARLWHAGYEIERFDHHQCIADVVTRR